MKGFCVAEQGHVVNALIPQAITTNALVSDYFSLKEYQHASIILTKGSGSATTVTLYEAPVSGGTGESTIVFNYWKEGTAAGDTLAAKVAATTAGITTGTASGVMIIIEVDAAELSDGYPYLAVHLSALGGTGYVSCQVVLSGGVEQSTTATAIT